MSFARKIARNQRMTQALGKITEAAQQAQGLNESLGILPKLALQIQETKLVLDTLLEDYQTLADELEVTQYLLRRSASLTPEQEKGYRSDYELQKANG